MNGLCSLCLGLHWAFDSINSALVIMPVYILGLWNGFLAPHLGLICCRCLVPLGLLWVREPPWLGITTLSAAKGNQGPHRQAIRGGWVQRAASPIPSLLFP